jgi:hypothetical protein
MCLVCTTVAHFTKTLIHHIHTVPVITNQCCIIRYYLEPPVSLRIIIGLALAFRPSDAHLTTSRIHSRRCMIRSEIPTSSKLIQIHFQIYETNALFLSFGVFSLNSYA